MGRRGKKKSKDNNTHQNLEEVGDEEFQNIKMKNKSGSNTVKEEDDEEIDEDEAFNSEDERMFGHFFTNSKTKRKSGIQGSTDENNDDSESDSNSDSDSESNDVEDDDDRSEADSEDEDEDDEDDDDGQYMLSLLDKLDSGTKKGEATSNVSSQMAKLSESEYSSAMSQKDRSASSSSSMQPSKALTLDHLMEGLEDTQGFQTLQKTFAKTSTATSAPLDKTRSDRMQRKIAYEQQAKEISRWTKVVQQNRQAETLDFKPKERLQMTKDTLVDKFQPTTDFEKEIEQALEEAGQQDEQAVIQAEEQALQDDLGANRLTMEEYKKRRGQLAQIRALMFYHEQKRHHIKKIKSKKYRKIRKKQRERLKDSALEAAMEEDADLAKEMQEKEETARIQERMTLAHKNTSKWAKRVLKRGKNVDVETRRALSAQLQRGDDLRRKMTGQDDDDENSDLDEDASNEDLMASARKVLEDSENGPDPTNGKSGLFKLSFMQKGMMKQRDKAKEEARRLLSELQEEEEDIESANLDTDANDKGSAAKAAKKSSNKMASKEEMQGLLKKGELVASSLAFGNSNTIATSGGIDIDLNLPGTMTTTNDDAVLRPSEASTEHQSTFESKKSIKNQVGLQTDNDGKSNRKKIDKQESKDENIEDNPWIQQSSNKDDLNVDGNIETTVTSTSTAIASNSSAGTGSSQQTKKRKARKGMVDIAGAVDILDSGVVDEVTHPGHNSNSNNNNKKRSKNKADHSTVVSSDGVKSTNTKNVPSTSSIVSPATASTPEGTTEGTTKLTMLSQEELIRRAFTTQSDEAVEDDFQKEKEGIIMDNDPTRKSSAAVANKGLNDVAGWGSWTGAGALPPPPSSSRRLPKKLQAPQKKKKKDSEKGSLKRKDEGKPNVIVNQKRLRKMASNFMLGDVPHPYSSRAEYEQAMLGGVGREWNVTGSFKDMTRPEILTRSGKMIQPISKKAKVARAPAKF